MIATDLRTLDALIVSTIEGITPRAQRKQASRWVYYERATAGASFTRRFRLDWEPGEYAEDGIFTPDAVETSADLLVVTDYRDVDDEVTFLVEDDKHQLRDVLNSLMAPDNGLLWAEAQRTEIRDDDQLGGQVVVHRFQIRYLRERA